MKPIEIPVVYAEYHTTGKHAATSHAPLHEVILIRLVNQEVNEETIVENEWPDFAGAEQVKKFRLDEEYGRLIKKYGRDRVVQVFGQPHDGRLRFLADRILTAFQAGMKLSKIIELGRPEADMLEIDGAAGDEPAPAARAAAPLGAIPSSATRDTENGTAPAAPSDVADELADVPDQPAIDGVLIEHLKDRNWPNATATGVARLVLEHGDRPIDDVDLQAVRGLAKRDALVAMRKHLAEYRDSKAAPATAER